MSRRCGGWLGGDRQLVNNYSPVCQLGGILWDLERQRKGTHISKPGLAM